MTDDIPSGSWVRHRTRDFEGIYLPHQEVIPHIPDASSYAPWGFIVHPNALDEVRTTMAACSKADWSITCQNLFRAGGSTDAWAEDCLVLERPHRKRRGKHHRMRTGGLLGEAVL